MASQLASGGRTLATPVLAPRRTAIRRRDLSAPLAQAIDAGVLKPKMTVLDYGCGRGGDVMRLRARGWTVQGWDPVYAPWISPGPADLVYLGYVLNVIADPERREAALAEAWGLTRRVLLAAVRTGRGPGRRFNDGVLTAAGTFQRYYAPGELAAWAGGVTGVEAETLGPGVVAVRKKCRPAGP